MNGEMTRCRLCPRRCGADRTRGTGQCHADAQMRIVRIAPHHWEEPCLSGTGGAGTVFFSGCSLGCIFCQNHAVSRAPVGEVYTPERLAAAMLRLQDEGVHNIELVTGGHFAPQLRDTLRLVRQKLHIPVVYNSGGYDSPEILDYLTGLVDIWLPDLKFTDETAQTLAACPDYLPTALSAIAAMTAQSGAPVFEGGLLKSGVIVRHLVLPGHRHESMALLDRLAQTVPPERILLSLMGQYTPTPAVRHDHFLRRRVTTFEYESVRSHALALGFSGYGQDRASAQEGYVPDFQTNCKAGEV